MILWSSCSSAEMLHRPKTSFAYNSPASHVPHTTITSWRQPIVHSMLYREAEVYVAVEAQSDWREAYVPDAPV